MGIRRSLALVPPTKTPPPFCPVLGGWPTIAGQVLGTKLPADCSLSGWSAHRPCAPVAQNYSAQRPLVDQAAERYRLPLFRLSQSSWGWPCIQSKRRRETVPRGTRPERLAPATHQLRPPLTFPLHFSCLFRCSLHPPIHSLPACVSGRSQVHLPYDLFRPGFALYCLCSACSSLLASECGVCTPSLETTVGSLLAPSFFFPGHCSLDLPIYLLPHH